MNKQKINDMNPFKYATLVDFTTINNNDLNYFKKEFFKK